MPSQTPAQIARYRALSAALEARVREACARHASVGEAAAALGVSLNYLSRVRRRLGLIDVDRAERAERVRRALEHPNAVAAQMLGLSLSRVQDLRREAQTQTQTEASPQP